MCARTSRRRVAAALVGVPLGLTSCAIDLEPPPPKPSTAPVAALATCPPLATEVGDYGGRWDSLALGSEVILVAAGDALGAPAASRGYRVTEDPCSASVIERESSPLLDGSTLGGDVTAQPQAWVQAQGRQYAFFVAAEPDPTADFGVRVIGRGIATYSAAEARLVEPVLLWTAERPSFGTGAYADADYVYAYGGLGTGFLAASAFVARAPVARVAEVGAWEYWSGSDHWTSAADEAWPLFDAGPALSVQYVSARSRFVAAYATPLAREITVRSGLGPAGPWSSPQVLAACDLPESDPQAFCAEVVLHAPFSRGATVALTHSVGSFDRPAETPPAEVRARFAHASLPAALP